jgi:alkanesulfonate monooxygenase
MKICSSPPTCGRAFSYVGIPPGFAFVGSYASVEGRVREFAALGISKFFINGYPHLEEIYRLGEHLLPRFRSAAQPGAANDLQPVPLATGLATSGNS